MTNIQQLKQQLSKIGPGIYNHHMMMDDSGHQDTKETVFNRVVIKGARDSVDNKSLSSLGRQSKLYNPKIVKIQDKESESDDFDVDIKDIERKDKPLDSKLETKIEIPLCTKRQLLYIESAFGKDLADKVSNIHQDGILDFRKLILNKVGKRDIYDYFNDLIYTRIGVKLNEIHGQCKVTGIETKNPKFIILNYDIKGEVGKCVYLNAIKYNYNIDINEIKTDIIFISNMPNEIRDLLDISLYKKEDMNITVPTKDNKRQKITEYLECIQKGKTKEKVYGMVERHSTGQKLYHYTRLVSSMQKEEFKEGSTKGLSTCHWGQKKLLLSEIEFLSKCSLTISKDQKIKVLYIGAAPGDHIPILWRFFRYEYILIDKAKFSIKGNGFTYINEFMTNDLARKLATELEQYTIIMINDARNINPNNSSEKNEDNIADDMVQSMEWYNIIKPEYASFKFRLPFNRDKFDFFSGELVLPVFGPRSTTECRLYKLQFDNHIITYSVRDHEQRMAAFNNIYRPSEFDLKYKRERCMCYDCVCEINILSWIDTDYKSINAIIKSIDHELDDERHYRVRLKGSNFITDGIDYKVSNKISGKNKKEKRRSTGNNKKYRVKESIEGVRKSDTVEIKKESEIAGIIANNKVISLKGLYNKKV